MKFIVDALPKKFEPKIEKEFMYRLVIFRSGHFDMMSR